LVFGACRREFYGFSTQILSEDPPGLGCELEVAKAPSGSGAPSRTLVAVSF
jgi:hypothetical protein